MSIDRHLEEIKSVGYTLISGVFSDDYCKKVKAQAKDDIELLRHSKDTNQILAGSLADKSQEMVLNNIQNKSYTYMNLISSELTNSVLSRLLKEGSYDDSEPYHLINSQIRALRPYAKKQQLHIDSNVPGVEGGYCLVGVVIVMLDDFTEKNDISTKNRDRINLELPVHVTHLFIIYSFLFFLIIF